VRSSLLVLLCAFAAPAAAEPKLALHIGEKDIDVANRAIHFSLGTVAKSAEIQVFSPDGELLYSGFESYSQPAPGTRLQVGWPDLGDKGVNFRIELKFTDAEDNWVGFQVIRFYLEIPHQEIAFATAKWDISKKEEPKLVEPLAQLQAAISKYAELMHVSLYVAGYTDTVGSAADNQLLSEKRAQAIASYFVAHGLKGVPILVRGFGEGAQAAKTADNVPEARNRRAQYIISTFEPEVAGPGAWRRVQ
jgi:outer membrane protein OmpA-like peptidoglycan-associated protein